MILFILISSVIDSNDDDTQRIFFLLFLVVSTQLIGFLIHLLLLQFFSRDFSQHPVAPPAGRVQEPFEFVSLVDEASEDEASEDEDRHDEENAGGSV